MNLGVSRQGMPGVGCQHIWFQISFKVQFWEIPSCCSLTVVLGLQLTILATDNSPGLQLFLENQWCDVPPMSDAFVINLGDLLERYVCCC